MEFVPGITWEYDYKVFQKFASKTSDKGLIPRFILNKEPKNLVQLNTKTTTTQ